MKSEPQSRVTIRDASTYEVLHQGVYKDSEVEAAIEGQVGLNAIPVRRGVYMHSNDSGDFRVQISQPSA
jgi:hypothetical protein